MLCLPRLDHLAIVEFPRISDANYLEKRHTQSTRIKRSVDEEKELRDEALCKIFLYRMEEYDLFHHRRLSDTVNHVLWYQSCLKLELSFIESCY